MKIKIRIKLKCLYHNKITLTLHDDNSSALTIRKKKEKLFSVILDRKFIAFNITNLLG